MLKSEYTLHVPKLGTATNLSQPHIKLRESLDLTQRLPTSEFVQEYHLLPLVPAPLCLL